MITLKPTLNGCVETLERERDSFASAAEGGITFLTC